MTEPTEPKFTIGDAVFPNIDMAKAFPGIGIGRVREMEWEYRANPDKWFYLIRFNNSVETEMWIVETALQRVAGV